MSRLVFPLAFVIALITLVVIIQSFSKSQDFQTSSNSNTAIKNFSVIPFTAPQLKVVDSDNRTIDEQKIKSGKVFLTFWSVNCLECDQGLPVIDEFASTASVIEFVLVSHKDELKLGQEKLSQLNIALKSYYDLTGEAFQEWEATMPSSYYIIDDQIRYLFPGRVSVEHLQALLTI